MLCPHCMWRKKTTQYAYRLNAQGQRVHGQPLSYSPRYTRSSLRCGYLSNSHSFTECTESFGPILVLRWLRRNHGLYNCTCVQCCLQVTGIHELWIGLSTILRGQPPRYTMRPSHYCRASRIVCLREIKQFAQHHLSHQE